MNIVLSCYADRKKSKGAFIISKGGKRVVKEVFSIQCREGGELLKEYTFESLIKGLRSVRYYVEHEDLLLIEVGNQHMVDWLNGSSEVKGYSSYVDEVYALIESLDCRYLFTKSELKPVKKLLEDGVDRKLQSIDDAFEGLE